MAGTSFIYQLQAFILDVPNLINNFLDFISGLPAKVS